MRLVELHVLQSFPVTCLNRDDVGAPKSAYFGGVPRARVSSQCWKRAVRMFAKELDKSHFGGVRTRFLTEELKKRLERCGVAAEDAEKAAGTIAKQLGGKEAPRGETRTSVLLFFSPKELDTLAEAIAQQIAQGKMPELKAGDLKRYLEKKEIVPMDRADIAVFGRMVANDPSLTMEGAALFSHAISTHEVANDVDYFTAVDDLKGEETEGAGHLGVLEFNTACYYRYVGLNWDLFTEHLEGLEKQTLKDILRMFLSSAILAVPNARKNSMFGQTPPGYVLGLARTGQPLSLANAFEAPVPPRRGYLEPSYEAMKKHFELLKQVYKEPYADRIRTEVWLSVAPEEARPLVSLDDFIGQLVEGVAHE